MQIQDFLGNALADAGAGAAAEVAVDTPVAAKVSAWEGRAFAIARRLAIIEASTWQDGPRLVPAPPEPQRIEPAPTSVTVSAFQAAIDGMGHRVHLEGVFLRCSRCRRRRKLASHSFWTRTPCAGTIRNRLRRQAFPDGSGERLSSPHERPPIESSDACSEPDAINPDAALDEDPFGHSHLDIDNEDVTEGSTALAAPSQAPLPPAERDSGAEREPRQLPPQAPSRLEALRLRVRAREAVARAGGRAHVPPDVPIPRRLPAPPPASVLRRVTRPSAAPGEPG